MGKKNMTSLKTAFWRFLIMLFFGLFVAVLIPFLLLLSGANLGVVTYADYSEQSVKYIAPIVSAVPDLSEVQLPSGCKYLLPDKDYKVIKSTLSEKHLARAMEYATTGKMVGPANKQYLPRFSKHLRTQLQPLFAATQEVAGQNLDFEVGHSKIREFEDVLLSFSDMKGHLKKSLEQQLQAEKMQKE